MVFKNDFSYTTDLELGKTVSIDVKKNQANAISLSFDGSYLSGERLPQILSIKTQMQSKRFMSERRYMYAQVQT